MGVGRPVIDAGPALNFFATNQERLLITIVGPLSAPERVRDEILRKARTDQARFGAATGVLSKLGPKYMQILSDDPTDALTGAVSDICGMPMSDRIRDTKDLGEIMVLAHAIVAALSGETVTVLIDDGGGRKLAEAQRNRLTRLRRNSFDFRGEIKLISTVAVLKSAVRQGHITSTSELRALYARMKPLDDGLLPLEQTGLLSRDLWT